MTKLEQLEKQRAELDKRRKEVGKRLAVEKRKETGRVKKEAREKEQAEAVEFFHFCRATIITVGDKRMSIYDYAAGLMKKYRPEPSNIPNRGNAAEGLQPGSEADGNTKTP